MEQSRVMYGIETEDKGFSNWEISSTEELKQVLVDKIKDLLGTIRVYRIDPCPIDLKLLAETVVDEFIPKTTTVVAPTPIVLPPAPALKKPSKSGKRKPSDYDRVFYTEPAVFEVDEEKRLNYVTTSGNYILASGVYELYKTYWLDKWGLDILGPRLSILDILTSPKSLDWMDGFSAQTGVPYEQLHSGLYKSLRRARSQRVAQNARHNRTKELTTTATEKEN